MEPLFRERPRTDPGIRRSSETEYSFLDRIDDNAFARVRDVFNDWFQRFADQQEPSAVADLRGRLLAKQSLQFYAAFWELYLHEVFTRLGFRVEVHPSGPRTTRPDFVIERGEARFYLEAVVPAPTEGAGSDSPGAQTVSEYIDRAYDEDFFVALRFLEAGALPRRRAVVAAVEKWLGSLAWDDWRDDSGIRSPLPETELEVGEWVLGLRAIPRSPARRGDRDFPTVGFYPGSGAFVESVISAIVPKLDEKASKYGELDAPHVVAAWVMSPYASAESIPSALFGRRLPLEVGRHALDRPPSERGGALWTPDRQRRDRPTAVLATGSWDFNYNAVARTLPRLWHNPWAPDQLSLSISRFPRPELIRTNGG